MTATEKWNRIVAYYNEHLHVEETEVESLWENIFADAKFFGYSRLDGEIDRQRKILSGTTYIKSDIIMKDGDRDLFVIELKRHDSPFSKRDEEQLLSYLRLLRKNIGVLICNKIYVYTDANQSDDKQEKVEIEFKPDNSDGIKFIELFNKAAFDEQAVKKFVHQKIESAKNVECIKEELTPELVMGLLKGYFANRYDDAEFEQAIEAFNIEIEPKGIAVGNQLPSRSALERQVICPDTASSEPKVGKIAQRMLREVLESGNISEDEVKLLLEKEYSKRTFNINYPLLVKERLPQDRVRYYKMPLNIQGTEYFLCSQWFEWDRSHLLNWISSKRT